MRPITACAAVAALLFAATAPVRAEPTAPDLPAPRPAADNPAQKSAEAIAAERAVAAARDRAEDDTVRDDNPAIKDLVAANPTQYLVICLAGCADQPTVVYSRPRPEPGKDADGNDGKVTGAVATKLKPVASSQN
jgi:hypothetical protein